MGTTSFHVDVVAADHHLWSGEATAVYARTVEGEIGILHGHQPVLLLLPPAPLRVVDVEGETHAFAIHGGVLYYRRDDHDHLVVLAERGEHRERIDVERARRRLEVRRQEALVAEEEDAVVLTSIAKQELRLRVGEP